MTPNANQPASDELPQVEPTRLFQLYELPHEDKYWRSATKREVFAMAAMQGIVGHTRLNPCGDFVGTDGLLQSPHAPEFAAKTAVKFADALLAELERTSKP